MYCIDVWRLINQRPTSHLENFKLQYLHNGSSDSLHVCSWVGFSGSPDWIVLFPVWPNPRWDGGMAASCWKFKWWYLRNRLSDLRHVWLQSMIFGVGGSNGAISSRTKFSRYIGENNVQGVLRLITI